MDRPNPAGEPGAPAGRIPLGRWWLVGAVVLGCGLAMARREGLWSAHLAFMGGAMAGFGALMWLERRSPWLRPRVVWVVTAVLLVMAVSAPPRESADVWSYVMYGRIVRSGHDPYTTPPSAFPHDRWLHLVRPVWRDVPSLYGPLFNTLSAVDVRLARGSGTNERLGFQALAALAVLAAMALVFRRTRDPAAMALLGLNPLVVVGVVNGGHNDALVGLAVLGGVLLAEDRRSVAAGAAFGLGILVKPVATLPLLALSIWTWRHRGRRPALTVLGLAGVVGLAGYQAGGGIAAAVRATGTVTDLVTRFSAWRVTWMARPPAVGEAPEHTLLAHGGMVPGWLPMAVVVGLSLLAAAGWARRTGGSAAPAVGAAGVCYLLAGLYVLPWYLMWVLPVLALRWPWRITWTGVAQASAVLVAYALALQKRFGPGPTLARAGFFDALALAELGALVLMVAWSMRPARPRFAPVPPTESRWIPTGGFEPRPSDTARAASGPPPGTRGGRPPRRGEAAGSR